MVRRGGVGMLGWGEWMLTLTFSGTLTGIVILSVNKLVGQFFSGNWQCVMLMTAILTFVVPFNSLSITKTLPPDKGDRNQTLQVAYIQKEKPVNGNFQEEKESAVSPMKTVGKGAIANESAFAKQTKVKVSSNGFKGQLKASMVAVMKKINLKSLWDLWVLGILIYWARRLGGYYRFVKELEASCESVADEDDLKILEKVKQDFKMQQPIKLYRSNKVASPMLVGLVRPRVILTQASYTASELEMVLRHELSHAKHLDLWIKWGVWFVGSFHWFNPVMRQLEVALTKALEERCDEAVMTGMSLEQRKQYGLTLLQNMDYAVNRAYGMDGLKAGNRLQMSTQMGGSKKEMKNRLQRIKKSPKAFKLSWTAYLLVIIVAASNFTFGMPIKAAPTDQTESILVAVIKNDGLYVVDLESQKEQKALEGSEIKQPQFSPDGKRIVALTDSGLYVKELGSSNEPVLVSKESEASYAWKDENALFYADAKGGIWCYDLKEKSRQAILPAKENNGHMVTYDELHYDAHGKVLYLKALENWQENGDEYMKGIGVMAYYLEDQTQEMILKDEPFNDQSLGLYASIAKVSEDGRYVYLFKKYQSGSYTADGVPIAVYDTQKKALKSYGDEVFMVAHPEQIAINPQNSAEAIINNGGMREAHWNKGLGLITADGSYQSLMKKEDLAITEHYGMKVQGKVTLTPSYSLDGSKVIYALGGGAEDYETWRKIPHALAKMDLKSGKVTELTHPASGSVDFLPCETGKDQIVFLREKEEKDDLSSELILLKDGKEMVLSQGIIMDTMDENELEIYITPAKQGAQTSLYDVLAKKNQ